METRGLHAYIHCQIIVTTTRTRSLTCTYKLTCTHAHTQINTTTKSTIQIKQAAAKRYFSISRQNRHKFPPAGAACLRNEPVAEGVRARARLWPERAQHTHVMYCLRILDTQSGNYQKQMVLFLLILIFTLIIHICFRTTCPSFVSTQPILLVTITPACW